MSAYFSCREASRLASIAIDRPLTLGQRVALHSHLAMCTACRAYRRQIIGLDRIFRRRTHAVEMDSSIRLDPAARQRMSQAMRKLPPS